MKITLYPTNTPLGVVLKATCPICGEWVVMVNECGEFIHRCKTVNEKKPEAIRETPEAAR